MEYKTLMYDFDNLKNGIYNLTSENECNRKEALCIIKEELNKFFTDFMCTEILFTLNTDNEFFGIQISPMLPGTTGSVVDSLFNTDKPVKFHHYLLEFDSKLFNGDFTVEQVLALLIHDINKLNSGNILRDVVAAMDCISMCTGKNIKTEHIKNNYSFFLFSIQDTVRKMTSAFEFIPSELAIADDFIRSYGLDRAYEQGMDNIKKCRNNLEGQVCCPTITLNWFMSKYDELSPNNHKDLVDDFKDCINLTGSKLLKRMFKRLVEDLGGQGLSYEDHLYYSSLTESAKKRGSLVSQIKYSGLKSLEDDIYEYRMRIKNIETENEAIYVIRQINNRMGIISDYLETEDLSDSDRERFFKLYDKYDSLREELSKKSVYSRKMYGLFVDYNALQQMSNGSMTMNTYY